jgi:hypothetical protein
MNLEVRILKELWTRFAEVQIVKDLREKRATDWERKVQSSNWKEGSA